MKRTLSGNAQYPGMAYLKRLLTTGSVLRNPGCEKLLKISLITRKLDCAELNLQDLGVISAYYEEEIAPANENTPHSPLNSMICSYQAVILPVIGVKEERCKVCGWRYPLLYGLGDQQRHAALARLRECHKDILAYRRIRGDIKRLYARLDREPVMISEDLLMKMRYSSVTLCAFCGKQLEGYWGQFKKQHLDSCKDRLHLPKALS